METINIKRSDSLVINKVFNKENLSKLGEALKGEILTIAKETYKDGQKLVKIESHSIFFVKDGKESHIDFLIFDKRYLQVKISYCISFKKDSIKHYFLPETIISEEEPAHTLNEQLLPSVLLYWAYLLK